MAITPQQQANNYVTDTAVVKAMKSPKRTSSSVAQKQKLIDDWMITLQNRQKGIKANLDQILTNKTLEEGKYITTPISEYGPQENEISKYNPELLALSKKYDDLVAQHESAGNDIINLDQAKQEMFGSVADLKSSANKAADSTNKGNALLKAIQVGSAQGTAGMQGATAGQLNKAQNEIENQFAPKFADTEAQRQAAMGAAAQIEAGIPTAMADIANKNATNRYNNSLTRNSWRSGSGGNGTLNFGQNNKKTDPLTGKTILGTPTIVSGSSLDNDNIPDYLQPKYKNNTRIF